MTIPEITPEIIRTWDITRLRRLAYDIRQRIIQIVSRCGGHLASGLGVVELTIALHYVFDTPRDKIIWDVGHQSYAHKLITGRWQTFETLRKKNGIAGFPTPTESEYDVFSTGHAGNSISVGLGLAFANRIKNSNTKIIAVIGDGSIVTGMAFEGLNNAGGAKENLIVILNDNEFSIGKSTGAMAKYLNRIITGRVYSKLKNDIGNLLGILPVGLSRNARALARKIEKGLKNLIAPSIIFEELGFRYLGPFDGHNLKVLIDNFQKVKNLRGPILMHILTKKGKGFERAEKEPEKYHSISPIRASAEEDKKITMSEVFGKMLVKCAEQDNRIYAITAGMCLGTGLAEFKARFAHRFFDVGISEQHAVSFAAGLALGGLKPVLAIYSTFLARAYDQIIQDVALANLPVIFAIDRAGLVGEDGPTHHGNFDLSYLSTIPNITVMAPKDADELCAMLRFAITYNRPIAIRYPKDQMSEDFYAGRCEEIKLGKGEIIYPAKKEILKAKSHRQRAISVLAVGSMVYPSLSAIRSIKETENSEYEFFLANMRFIKPLDHELILQLNEFTKTFITVEENVLNGGFGAGVREFVMRRTEKRVVSIALPDKFIEHGSREQLLDQYDLTREKLKKKFLQVRAESLCK